MFFSTAAARILRVLCVATVGLASSAVAKEPADSVEFFENRIRPVLVEHCFKCHSVDAAEIGGSLLLDSSDGMFIGGDSGPAITPGDAEASILVSAIRYESSEMPPEGKLPDEVVDDFARWIAAGAVDPRKSTEPTVRGPNAIDLDEGRKFWAFRPLRLSEAPTDPLVASRGIIDQFIGQALVDADISPNSQSDALKRLRRLAFDLTGLPPSVELQNDWLADPSPSHWIQIVDGMLASPAFGEHWARHWMDIARYADSNGSDFNATFHEAWRYRDYLVRSFAADRPFDEMIRQQIAGDLMTAESDAERHDNLVASTFLMLGTKMLSERDKPKLELDVVDEQIDTIGRAFMGLTLGCARCHDHKFDPVPTEDYYALAGIFKSTVSLEGESQEYVSTWQGTPLPTSNEHRDAIAKYEAEKESLDKAIKSAEADVKQASATNEAQHRGIIVDDSAAEKTGVWKDSNYIKQFIGTGYVHDDNSMKGEASIRFVAAIPDDGEYEVRIAYSPGASRSAAVPITIETADGEENVTIDERRVSIAPMWGSLGKFRFMKSSPAVVTISNVGTTGYVIADAVQFLSREETNSSENVATGDPTALAKAKARVESLRNDLKSLQSSAPEPVPVAMAPADRPSHEIADSVVHIRGDIRNLGKSVPRGFLRVCGGGQATIENPRGSGRLELADWLTDPDHPLVARVFVNRVWMHLMGEGIVRTVDNFGSRGELPSHPELLDALSVEFIRSGWHIKPLIRQIVCSTAYQRSSQYDAQKIAIDPENRLWWRMHRRRLTAESIRESMLSSAGILDHSPAFDLMAGQKVLVSGNDNNSTADQIDAIGVPRRSIYLPLVRGYLSPMMTALDAADPDLLVGHRPTTNVPGQALVLINSPIVAEWARITSQRVVTSSTDFEDQIKLAYQSCLHRLPNTDDREIADAFFAGDRSSPDRWHQWIAAMFASTEFRLLD